jgi:DHA1 family multidrug resistance protein-like MFS transporter
MEVALSSFVLGQGFSMQPSNRKNLIILFFTLVVVMLGFGMAMPVFPFLITRLGGSGDEFGALIAVYSVMQLIFAPVWGSVSDRIGRKPVLLIGMLGTALSLVLIGLATDLWMLFVARILSGLLASAMLPTTMAYIGDSTSEQDRGGGIGQLGAAAGLGVILGPGIGGWLAGDSLTLPFFLAAGLSLGSLVLIAFLLPESLAPEARHRESKVSLVDFGELWRALFSPVGILLVVAFVVSFGAINFQAIFGLYALKKFNFDPGQVGTVLVVVGLTGAVVQGVMTGPVTRRWGEAAVIRFSFLTNALGFLVLLTANSYETVLLTTGVYTLAHGLLRPSVQALTSKRAVQGQGTIMGLNNSFMSLGQIAGPLWAGLLFDINVDMPYLSGAVIMLAGFIVSLCGISPGKTVSKLGTPSVVE